MGDPETGSGGTGLMRRVEKPSDQKKSHRFMTLLLVCVGLTLLCYTVLDLSLSFWDKSSVYKQYQMFFNRSKQVHQPHVDTMDPTPNQSEDVQTATPPSAIQYHQGYPRNYQFIMDHPEACRNVTPFLVLMVPVAPDNVAARNAIRQTWGKEGAVKDVVVLTLFMLGISANTDPEKVKQEDREHNDLIQSNFVDSYLNLTIKTMVIMDWLATRCRAAVYAMKVDSDMFLNIDNLVAMLQKQGIPKVNYLTGMLMWNRPVLRSRDSKWYVPLDLFPDPVYPTYTLGMGYIFSNDLPEKYVEVSKTIKPFNIEDAYIGMCMKKLGLEPTSPPNPWQFKAYNQGYDRCLYSKIITYILGSAQELINYWTDLKKPGPYC